MDCYPPVPLHIGRHVLLNTLFPSMYVHVSMIND